LPFIDTKVNPKAVFDYLVLNLYEQEEEGFIKNILELQSGALFHLSNNDENPRYWPEVVDGWERFVKLEYTVPDKNITLAVSLLFVLLPSAPALRRD
jgi:hypothetical protein